MANSQGVYNRPNMRKPHFEEFEIDRPLTTTYGTDEGRIPIDVILNHMQLLKLSDRVACIQNISRREDQTLYEITFKENKDECMRVMAANVLVWRGLTLKPTDTRAVRDVRIKQTVTVLIYEAPFELENKHIYTKLQKYGELHSQYVGRHHYKNTTIQNGVRSLEFKTLTTAIPTTMFVRGNLIRLRHEGQVRVPFCTVCRTRGHYRLDCPTVRGDGGVVHEPRPDQENQINKENQNQNKETEKQSTEEQQEKKQEEKQQEEEQEQEQEHELKLTTETDYIVTQPYEPIDFTETEDEYFKRKGWAYKEDTSEEELDIDMKDKEELQKEHSRKRYLHDLEGKMEKEKDKKKRIKKQIKEKKQEREILTFEDIPKNKPLEEDTSSQENTESELELSESSDTNTITSEDSQID